MRNLKIVILDGQRTNPGDLSWGPIEALGDLTVYPTTAPEELAARMAGAEVVILDKPSITRELLEACPELRLITLFATGFNNIDIEAARERGVLRSCRWIQPWPGSATRESSSCLTKTG